MATQRSECNQKMDAPSEGDLRLVRLFESASETRPCDDVHFGGVELFRQGRWGHICNARNGGNEEAFTLDAKVRLWLLRAQ